MNMFHIMAHIAVCVRKNATGIFPKMGENDVSTVTVTVTIFYRPYK